MVESERRKADEARAAAVAAARAAEEAAAAEIARAEVARAEAVARSTLETELQDHEQAQAEAVQVTIVPPQPGRNAGRGGRSGRGGRGGRGNAVAVRAAPAPTEPVAAEVPTEAASGGRAESVAKEDDAEQCVMCIDRPRAYALVPCGHLCLCEVCWATLEASPNGGACPICRQQVVTALRIYH